MPLWSSLHTPILPNNINWHFWLETWKRKCMQVKVTYHEDLTACARINDGGLCGWWRRLLQSKLLWLADAHSHFIRILVVSILINAHKTFRPWNSSNGRRFVQDVSSHRVGPLILFSDADTLTIYVVPSRSQLLYERTDGRSRTSLVRAAGPRWCAHCNTLLIQILHINIAYNLRQAHWFAYYIAVSSAKCTRMECLCLYGF